jgi:hypothetical protein
MVIKSEKKQIRIAEKSKATASSVAFKDISVVRESTSPEASTSAQLLHDADNRDSIISDISDTSTNSHVIAEAAGAQSKCSFFAAVGSLFSNLNCKKNRKFY